MSELNARAKLTLDKTGFDAGVASATKSINKFGDDLKSNIAGAFSVAAITAFAKSTIDAVSRIADLSKELGISAESLQELEYGAKLSGASIDTIATAFRALSKARAEALQDKNSKSGQVFAAMGISSSELKANSIEQTFRRIAEVVRTTDFGANELAFVSEILGKSGAELIPVFRNGITEAADEAKKLGIIFSESVVSEIDKVGDSIDRLIRRLRVPMAGAIKFVADRLSEMVDLLDFVVGGAGAGIGAALGGGDPFKAFADHGEDILDNRIKEEQAAVDAAKNPKKEDDRKKKNVELHSPKSSEISRQAVQSDQFQRIGAFTGVSAQATQADLARRQLTTLEALRDDMTKRGILIKGVD